MEVLLFFGVVLLWAFGPRLLASTARAGWRTATGKGAFGANFEASFIGMSALQTRLQTERIDGDGHSFDVIRVEVKGLFPIRVSADLVVSASIFDITDMDQKGEPIFQPVTCLLDKYQEPDSICYQDTTRFGRVEPDTGFVDWQSVLAVIPETLTGPRSGARKFKIFITFYDANDPPRFQHGFRSGDAINTYIEDFQWNVTNVGYREVSERRQEAERLGLQLAVAVALGDGELARTEGQVLQHWVNQKLSMLEGTERETKKSELNQTMKSSYAAARAGTLGLEEIVANLNEVADTAMKLDTVELCLEVLSADGHADQQELRLVHWIAEGLEIDLQRFQEMRDKKLSGLSTKIQSASDFYALLGIDHSWNQQQIRSHLNHLYSQWNSRAESIEDSEKRQQAEQMLETIAAARQALLK